MSLLPVTNLFSRLWPMTLGDERIRIAVLDGPVDRSHIAFEGARLNEIRGSLSSPVASQGFGAEHGTYVASLIFGQHDGPVKGIAPQCSGLLIRIFRDAPTGAVLTCSQVDLARAITAAVDRGAQIINISGGEFTSSGSAHPILGDVLDRCDRQGVLIVAAAGNNGCDCLHIPAAHLSVLAVGAATAAGKPLESSNWGTQYRTHGILAIGEHLLGAAPGGKIVEQRGTSAAAAVVSGVAGLLMSLEIRRGVSPNGPRIRELLLESSDPCPYMLPSKCPQYLTGVMNVDRALSLISKKGFQMNLNEPNAQQHPSVMPSNMNQPAEMNGASISQVTSLPASTSPPAAMVLPPSSNGTSMSGISPSACACGCGTPAAAQLVYVLGQIGFAFSSQARIDSLRQHMPVPRGKSSSNPHDSDELIAYLKANPWETSSIIWTVSFGAVPVYAISVGGPYALKVGEILREFLEDQIKGEIERVSIPGVLRGRISLMTGEQLPVIHPEIRGMCSWSTAALVAAVAGEQPSNRAANDVKQQHKDKTEGIQRFLHKVYHELRNLGQSSRDRSINYSATNAFEIAKVFESAAKEQLELLAIDAEPSLVCRLGSDCWDVMLRFFSPTRDNPLIKRVYRFTVDVSDVVPVTVGPMREWTTAD